LFTYLFVSTFHTPSGSPRIESSLPCHDHTSTCSEEDEEDYEEEYKNQIQNNKEDAQVDDLDDQLMKLTKEKERVSCNLYCWCQSSYSL
jgi:hypothetical protein